MQVASIGDGSPEVSVICCIHGDERCGLEAFREFFSYQSPFEYESAVQFIIANEEAMRKGERVYKGHRTEECEGDLNRAFDFGPSPQNKVEEIAENILDIVQGTRVLDIHSTESYHEPVAFIHQLEPNIELALETGVSKIVDTTENFFNEALIAHANAVSVECGMKGTGDAIFNAHTVIRNFLATNGVIQGSPEHPRPEFFKLIDEIEKKKDEDGETKEYAYIAENFKKVKEGEVYATTVDDDSHNAGQDVYPILMSAEGYPDKLGYLGVKYDRNEITSISELH